MSRIVLGCALVVVAAYGASGRAGAAVAVADARAARFEALRAELVRRAARPEAAAPLAGLERMREQVAPRQLAQALRALLDLRQTDPLVAAQAAHLLSLEHDRHGEGEAAESLRRQLGWLDEAWVLGPFDAQGRGALERVLPPEEEAPDPGGPARFAGKLTTVAWRRAPREAFRQGALMLGAFLRPDSDAVAYVAAFVKSDRDRWVALRLGSAGPCKAWLNGAPVLRRDVVRPARPDQDAAAVRLRRGPNLLVVKTVITSGSWRLYLRLTELDGRPSRGLETLAEPSAGVSAPGWQGRAPARRPPVRELADLVRRRAEGGPRAGAPERWLDYAETLALVRGEDADDKAIEAAAERAAPRAAAPSPAMLPALLFLGQVARDDDDRLQALSRALPLLNDAGERALVLAELGRLAERQQRRATALAHLRAAVALDPGCVAAHLALAAEEQGDGLHATALARLDGLPAAARVLPRVVQARVRALRALGRLDEAEALLLQLLEARRDDVEILRDLAQAARGRGDLAAAARRYGEAAAWRPDLGFLSVDRARMLEGSGDIEGAEAELRALAGRLPDEARVHEELGRLLARVGRLPAAVASLRRSLELRPQQPALRRYVAVLAGDASARHERARGDAAARPGAEDLVREYAADAEALARPILLGPPPRDDDSSVVLLERHVVRVHQNGLADRFVQRVVHLRTERAARDGQHMEVRHVPGRQEVEIRQARVLRRSPGGGLDAWEATGRDERDLSEPWYGLYYDARAEVVLFEGVRAGDVVELQYTVSDVAQANDMADYFGDLELIAGVKPTRRWDYTLIAPAARTFHFNPARLPGLRHESERRGAEVIHRFVAEDVARIDLEPAMPGFAEVAPYLHVSTYRDWNEVGRWYWNLVADQLHADAALARAAREATAGARTVADKVRALHRLVIEGTRYVGLEFGIHGFKPYKVTQVMQRRFGDCKDKAALLVALLREVGVPAELVLLRTRRAGRVDPRPASLAVFDHAIAYVPALGLYLDGTAEFAGMVELPSQDQGVMALHVSAAGPRLTETPVLPAARNRAERLWKVELGPDGAARIDERVTVTGQAAHEWRSHYQTPGERQERYGRVWEGRLAGGKLDGVAMEGIEDRNQAVRVHARGWVPHLGQRRGEGELHLPSSSREADFTPSYARLGTRRWPLVLGFPWQHVETLELALPEGFRVVRAPADRRIEGAFGGFEFQVRAGGDGRSLVVHSALSVERDRILPGEYAAFRAFLREIDGILSERIVVSTRGAQ